MAKLTYEQQLIVNQIDVSNVSVLAVSGAGKSFCLFSVAKTYPSKSILLLTYSSSLKAECREKARGMDISNMKIHSFHSFNTGYYGSKDYTDRGIIKTLKENITPKPYNFDIILCDEYQDATPTLYDFTVKLIEDNENQDAKVLVCGDSLQNIFAYAGASPKYLLGAEKHFLPNSLWTVNMRMSKTFRVPSNITKFLSDTCGLDNGMVSHNEGGRVRYVMCDLYNGYDTLAELEKVLEEFEPGDIFILAPSVHSKSVVRLENMIQTELAHRQVPVFVSTQDSIPNEAVMKGKLVISSVHASKGKERKCVIVMNFHYSKNWGENPDKIPNETYVAITRATEKVLLLHHFSNDFYGFIDQRNLKDNSEFVVKKEMKLSQRPSSPRDMTISVTKLLKNIPSLMIDSCMEMIEIKRMRLPNRNLIELNDYTKGRYGSESVSCINGVAIPAYYEFKKTGNSAIFNGEVLSKEQFSSKLLLRAATVYVASQSEFLFLQHQIHKYNWIPFETFEKCADNIKTLKLNDPKFEVSVKKKVGQRVICGALDIVDNQKVFELKCVGSLSDLHILQLVMYMYLHNRPDMRYYLYNVISNELLMVKCSVDNLSRICEMIVV